MKVPSVRAPGRLGCLVLFSSWGKAERFSDPGAVPVAGRGEAQFPALPVKVVPPSAPPLGSAWYGVTLISLAADGSGWPRPVRSGLCCLALSWVPGEVADLFEALAGGGCQGCGLKRVGHRRLDRWELLRAGELGPSQQQERP